MERKTEKYGRKHLPYNYMKTIIHETFIGNVIHPLLILRQDHWIKVDSHPL